MALSAKAFGSKNVLGILLPEQDSSDDSRQLAEKLAAKFEEVEILSETERGAGGFGSTGKK